MKNSIFSFILVALSFGSLYGMQKKIKKLSEEYEVCEKKCSLDYIGYSDVNKARDCFQSCAVKSQTRLKLIMAAEQVAKNKTEKKNNKN